MSRILLLHGLWMRSLVMRPLAARLRAEGFAVEPVDYASIVRGPERCIAWLVQRLRRAPDPDLHLVGHSLGGVVAVRAAREAGEAFHGRIVCLGSPLAGSATARDVQSRPGLSLLVGRSAAVLAAGAPELPGSCEVGMVAGRRALGLGRLLHRFDEPSDGSVAVAETRVPGLADHLELGVSHTGLVYSREVARATAVFLRSGRFPHADAHAATR